MYNIIYINLKNGDGIMKKRKCENCQNEYIIQSTRNGSEFGECDCGIRYKKCVKCNEWLIADKHFNKQSKGKFGYRSKCRYCCNKYDLQWRKDNKEHIKEYYENTKEHKKKYFEENKEHILEWRRQWRDSESGQVSRLNRHNKRRELMENQGSGITIEQWLDMMNFFDWKCAYSDVYVNSKKNRSVDHIIPLNRGGLHEIWNCVPMYRNHNSSKNNSIPMEWYKNQKYYSETRLNKIIEWQKYSFEKYSSKNDKLILIDDLLGVI